VVSAVVGPGQAHEELAQTCKVASVFKLTVEGRVGKVAWKSTGMVTAVPGVGVTTAGAITPGTVKLS